MDSEKIHVKLGISGTYWDKKPQYRILIDNTVIKEGEISGASDEVEYVEFDHEYSTESASLKVQLLNKSDSDTVQSEDKTSIVKDMLLNVISLEIDDIDLSGVMYTHSDYYVDSPVQYNGETTQLVKNCTNLGWNGTWTLSWTNPFYIWLLENL